MHRVQEILSCEIRRIFVENVTEALLIAQLPNF